MGSRTRIKNGNLALTTLGVSTYKRGFVEFDLGSCRISFLAPSVHPVMGVLDGRTKAFSVPGGIFRWARTSVVVEGDSEKVSVIPSEIGRLRSFLWNKVCLPLEDREAL